MHLTNTKNLLPKSERIVFLDVLRGIAIQFIFIANINYLSGYYFFEKVSVNLPSDKFLEVFIYTLVDGKFYSIFSLLFGIGCYVQYQNTLKYDTSFSLFFRKRMFWLLIFGLLHLFGLWLGDILTLYAVLGFALMSFINVSSRRLIIYAIVFTLLPIFNIFLIYVLGFNYTAAILEYAIGIYEQNAYPIIDNGRFLFPDLKLYIMNESFLDFSKMTFANAFVRISNILLEGRIFKVFAIFLLGIWVGRKIIQEKLLSNLLFLRKTFLIGMGIGLPLSMFRTYCEFYTDKSELWGFLHTLAYVFGTLPMALGMVAGLALIFHNNPSIIKWLAPVGKMAFTNYIMQTIICITIFYGIGLGFAGILGYTMIILLAIAIFLMQVIFSRVWLQHFHFGPLEWIWRQLSYGRIFPIKKT